ncbi:MAG: hypothetical protein IJ036_03675 [Lachnospiraceae bacterium]|nr:hypothetical protein [Lachnospiraceae bacterium]
MKRSPGHYAKIITGCVLLGISLIWLFVLMVTMLMGDELDGFYGNYYESGYSLQVTYEGCREIGDVLESADGEAFQASEGCTYYLVRFTVENHGDHVCTESPSYIFRWSEEVQGEKYAYEIEAGKSKLFYEYTEAWVPIEGTTQLDLYLMVEEGAEMVTAYYYPNWSLLEEVSMEVSLSKPL